MRFPFYRGVSKIEAIYNDIVDRTEDEMIEEVVEKHGKEAAIGFQATLGKLCGFLSLPDLLSDVSPNGTV